MKLIMLSLLILKPGGFKYQNPSSQSCLGENIIPRKSFKEKMNGKISQISPNLSFHAGFRSVCTSPAKALIPVHDRRLT